MGRRELSVDEKQSALPVSLVMVYLARRCISIRSKILSLLFHMDLPPHPFLSLILLPFLFLSFSFSSGLLLGDVDLTKDCAWDAGVEGSIREARRRLVWCGTLSLKYPEVFFPRNCRSLSFLRSLNGPGYPGRIEKLPPCSISLFSLFSLLSTCPFCSHTFFFSVSAREAIYTRLRLANSRPLLDDDKVP